jgi:outer membrane protein TolC
VLRAESALAVAESTAASLRAHLADVESMFDSGAVARNDYLAAAVSLADSEQRLLQARNGLDLANAAYNRALGRTLDSPVDLDEQLPNIDAAINPDSLESLTALALANRDELSGLQAAADAYRSQSDAKRAETLPQLAVTGGYVSLPNDFLNQDDYWMIGIGLQWEY